VPGHKVSTWKVGLHNSWYPTYQMKENGATVEDVDNKYDAKKYLLFDIANVSFYYLKKKRYFHLVLLYFVIAQFIFMLFHFTI
jgi:hypothetical protein